MSKILQLNADQENELSNVGHALSSPIRIEILKLLYFKSYNVKEIANKLKIPASSAAIHIRALEVANLIQTKIEPGSRGSMKLCSRKNDYLSIRLVGNDPNVNQTSSVSIPVGQFTDCKVTPTCGIATADSQIGYEDRPVDFFNPTRTNAQILWSSSGYVEYKVSAPLLDNIPLKQLTLVFEACSEAPNYKEDWKSDITVWINGIEIGTWRSPGDFGERRGKLNPSWWGSGVTQYGKLLNFQINANETTLNGEHISDCSLHVLKINPNDPITLRIGNKDDAKYVGGFNLFGEKFGDYPQNIVMSFIF